MVGERPSHPLQSAFLALSAIALVVFTLVQVTSGRGASDLSVQAKKLMPQIRAELVDAPLTQQQLEWPLQASDGRTLTLAQLPRDRLVFLNFWATWCEPCTRELPSMFRMRAELAGEHAFMLVAVSYDEAWPDISDFFRRWIGRVPADHEMVLLKDPIIEDGHTLRETFGTKPIPDSYLVLDGRVIARFVNAREWNDPTILQYMRLLAPRLGPAEGQ